MLKKLVGIFLAVVICAGLLAACAPGGQSEPPIENTYPSLTVRVDESLLAQDENNIKQVVFTAVAANAEGAFRWFVNGVDRNVSGDVFSFTPPAQGTYTVYCKLERGGQEPLVSPKHRIVVFGVSMDVSVSNAGGSEALEQYVNAVAPVSFRAGIANVVGMSESQALQNLSWYVNGEKQEGTQGQSSFVFTPPNAEGIYDVFAAADCGKVQYESNFKRVYVRMGKLTLACEGETEQKQGEQSQVVFTVQTEGAAVEWQVVWSVNGKVAASGENSFSFTPSAVGAYRVGATVGNIEAESVYVICGVPVGSEEELRTAYNEGAAAVFLTQDIGFKEIAGGAHFTVGRPFAVAGNGKTLTSEYGINIIMNVTADGVVLYNFTIRDAAKYPIQFYRARNCYAEALRLQESGYAGLHVNRSQITAKNIVVDGCNYAGIELSHPDYDADNAQDYPATLTVLGDFTFLDAELPAPIYTQNDESACRVLSDSFNEFLIAASVGGTEMIIRRWCNDGCSIGWTVIPPAKTTYTVGEEFDMRGILLRVSVCGNKMNFDYEFLLMALDNGMTVRLDFIGLDGSVQCAWYGSEYRQDGQLIFTDEQGAQIDGIMQNTEIVQVKIDLAGVDIGKYALSVLPAALGE